MLKEYLTMGFVKSKLPWIAMAGVMIIMLSQGFSDNNIMIVMMLAIMILLMLFWVRNRNN
jgi:hypothetical protein